MFVVDTNVLATTMRTRGMTLARLTFDLWRPVTRARITIRAESATLQDLGSKNGTIVNGSAIQGPVQLTDGAVIVLGATALKFRIVEALGSTETVTATPSRTNP